MRLFKKIFSIVPDCHVPAGYYRVLWRRHFYDGIRSNVEKLFLPENVDFSWARKGHDVELGPIEKERAENCERIWDQIKNAHRDHGLDAVLSYCFAHDLDLSLVKQTIQMGVPWINFFCDSTHMFEKVDPLARVVSLNWFPETAAIPRYQALSVPWFHKTFALNPDYLPDLTPAASSRRVAFIGLPTTNRITQLGWLRLFGCKVDIRGHGWTEENRSPFYNPQPGRKRLLKAITSRGLAEKILRRLFWPIVKKQAHGPLEDEAFFEFVRSSLLVLGLNQGKDSQGRLSSYMKFRDLEFPGYGCCYLTERNEDVINVFEPGKDVLTYQTMSEAAEQAKRIVRHPDEALRIGYAGRQRILSDHTWPIRLAQISATL